MLENDKAKLVITLKSIIFSPSFTLTFQNGYGVWSRLALFILEMGLAYSVLNNGHFEPVYLLQASKSYGKEIWL